MRKLDWIVCAVTILSLGAVVATPIQNIYAQEIPKAQCRESSWNGKVACGYNCVESSWNGKVACAEWSGGACKVSSWNGEITCRTLAPSDWLSRYANNSNSNNPNSGIYGAWALQNGRWNGILRMQGNSGRMILANNTGAAVEQIMILKVNPQGGYILDGEVLSWYVRGGYNADIFYIQQFSKDSITVRNCDENSKCNSVSLVYLGK
ncbi:hypothetical protein DP113_14350 [Brasilonema octagenarum UFV-E1]|uniref:Uncharacterized protein n=2 Tax=Brasilonema TaxID=383614 RepID=A0A856MF46_9CYAN|nr:MULTISPECIES: hypothetical protein [Brasilonema]NMF66281.1 hypothetical protein [Brasilonema octagenarum UFV-OR1]QDL08934.1 hypothetical protein DP114_14420 [Brasilonema sennae CENA114]QDL15290.1 hypothetical protein DP113_14350 [Brasilonema octagenarum UFV-E1]